MSALPWPFDPSCDAPGCGAAHAGWGFGCDALRGVRGRWYCFAHRHLCHADGERRSPVSTIVRPEATASGQGSLL